MNDINSIQLLGIIILSLLAQYTWAKPSNDGNGNAIVINALPFSNEQDTSGATTQPNEPVPVCMEQGKASVWYSYQADADQLLIIDTFGSDYNTSLSVWTGSNYANFTSEGCSDDSSNLPQSQVAINAKGGTLYWIGINGYLGQTGKLVFHAQAVETASNDQLQNAVTLKPKGTLDYVSMPIDTQQATLDAGEKVVSCAPNSIASVWYQYTPSDNQRVVFDTFLSNYDTVLGLWSQNPLVEVACNDNTDGEQSQIALDLNQSIDYFISITGQSSPVANPTGVAVLRMSAPPGNDDMSSAALIETLPYTQKQNTGGATEETDEPASSCSPSKTGIWYKFIPEKDLANVTFTTVSSSYDTVLSIWTGIDAPIEEISCNDNSAFSTEQSLASQLSLPLSANTTYYIRVSHAPGEGGNLNFAVSEGILDFSIATQPLSQKIAVGETTTLTVELYNSDNNLIPEPSGDLWAYSVSGPIHFQWYQGNVGNISTPVGIDNATFTSPTLNNSIQYWVRVSNPTGQLDSDVATIAVGDTPLPPDEYHNGIGLDPQYQTIETVAHFTGLVTKSLENPKHLTQLTQKNEVFITANIKVDPRHLRQSADILIVGIYQLNLFTGIYMRDGEQWKEWKNWSIPDLTAAQTNVTLGNTIEVPVFKGNFNNMPGKYWVYVGYRLSDGTLIYTSEPTQFTVQ